MTTMRREPAIVVRVDSSGDGSWQVDCVACGRTLGRKIAGTDATTVGSIVGGHSCQELADIDTTTATT